MSSPPLQKWNTLSNTRILELWSFPRKPYWWDTQNKWFNFSREKLLIISYESMKRIPYHISRIVIRAIIIFHPRLLELPPITEQQTGIDWMLEVGPLERLLRGWSLHTFMNIFQQCQLFIISVEFIVDPRQLLRYLFHVFVQLSEVDICSLYFFWFFPPVNGLCVWPYRVLVLEKVHPSPALQTTLVFYFLQTRIIIFTCW